MNQVQRTVDTGQDADSQSGCETVVTPLRKQRLNGEIYTRPPEVEALIAELVGLPRKELIARAGITNRANAKYISSECLVYFVRASRHDDNCVWFERLYRILIERVLRKVPKVENPGGKTESLSREAVRDYVYDRFVRLLAEDRSNYVVQLDFFEVRFNRALVCLKHDAQKKVWKDEKHFQPLGYNEETNELSPEIERAAGAFDSPDLLDFEDPAYRLRFDAAIMALPPEQARIIHMLKQGFPIDSKEPGVMTIAKVLGRCEKTVRTYRDRAFSALRTALANGEER